MCINSQRLYETPCQSVLFNHVRTVYVLHVVDVVHGGVISLGVPHRGGLEMVKAGMGVEVSLR